MMNSYVLRHACYYQQQTFGDARRESLGRLALSCQCPVCIDVTSSVARVQKIGRVAKLIGGDDLERCTKRVSDVSQKLNTIGKAR
jgi:hypothetical protein